MPMIIYVFPIRMLLIVQIAIAADNIVDTFLNFKDNHIRGIHLYGTDILGVLLDKEVYVGKVQDEDFMNVTEIARIPLDKSVYLSNSLEFKLINASSALTCTTNGCCVCSLSPDLSPNCFPVGSPQGRYKLKEVSAALINKGIIHRTVNDGDFASIHYLSSDKNYEDSGRRSIDSHYLSDFETVAGFSTETHSYLIGSAKRYELPIYRYFGALARQNYDIRITRICNKDKTPNLASRIDLVLSCEGIPYEDILYTVTNIATAAVYLPESSKLLVAFQHGLFNVKTNEGIEHSTDQNYICSYNFTDLQWRFSETWDKCQSMPKTTGDKAKCKKWPKNLFDLDEECFLFSFDDNTNTPYCSAYNGAMGDNQFDNCDLNINTSNAYSSTENFKPYDGNLIFNEIHSEPIVAIRQIPNEKALYALRRNYELIRISFKVHENPFYTFYISAIHSSFPAKPGIHLLEVVPKGSKVLFASRNDGTIHSFTPSCNFFYKTCQSIVWNDPLNCVYCANEDGSGNVVSDNMTCLNNVTYQNVCPPIILAATEIENDTLLITGIDLNKFLEDPEVTVCESPCYLTSAIAPQSSSIILIFVTTFCLLGAIGIVYLRITLLRAKRLRRDDDIPLELMSDQLNPKDLIVLNTQPLGSGISATVYKGSYKTATGEYMPVAVKVLNNEYALLVNTAEFISELEVLRQVEHSNIVNFIGHTYIDRTLHIVTEYMAGGSLFDYILNDDTPLKYQDTFDYMDQILSAMVYLSEQQIVHRDLAARNCLLNHDDTVLKVSDFGLARSVDFKGEYQILHDNALPTRWIAIEAFSLHKFTEKTDVWSFGVLVWELFTRGAIPYDPLDHFQIQDFLNKGQRLQCPQTCPNQIYALMITCWDSEPTKRPTFKQLQKDLKNRIRHLMIANKQLIETGYERPNNRLLTNFEIKAAV